MQETQNWSEFIITRLIKIAGYSAIVFIGAIFFFLLKEGLNALTEVQFSALISDRWYRAFGGHVTSYYCLHCRRRT